MSDGTPSDRNPFEVVRSIGGLAAIFTLLALIILSFLRSGQPLADATVFRLLLVIGALLGIDILRGAT